jgi:pyrroline-5-carboxylate reductase
MMDADTVLGFVGTGTIAAAIIEGLCLTRPDQPIIVSPRSADIGAALAARYRNVTVAASNQAVLDAADVVVLAVRPQVADEVLAGLAFRPGHRVISLIATVTLDYLRTATAPADTVTRAVPLPSVARRQGPTAIFPPDPLAQPLFDALGKAIVLEDEAEFDVFTAATAVMASYFAFAHTVAGWMEDEGIDAARSRAYVGQMFEGLAHAPADRSFANLADEYQTRGGLNEQVVREVTSDGRFAELDSALDAILVRLRGSKAG